MGRPALPDPAGPAAVHHCGCQVTRRLPRPPRLPRPRPPRAGCWAELTRVCLPSSRSEMEKWVEDIQMAIDLAEKSSGPMPEFLASSPPDNSKWRAEGGPVLTWPPCWRPGT